MSMADLVDAANVEDSWGLHDGILRRLDWDWVHRTLRLDVTIALGARQERCRDGSMDIQDVAFVVVEPPAAALRAPGGDWEIDVGRMTDLKRSPSSLPPPPEGHWVNWIFSHQANAFLYICAAHAAFVWTGDERTGSGGVFLPGDEIPDP